MTDPVIEYKAGGWTTRRGEEEGILLYAYKGEGKKRESTAIWIDKQTATRFAHTVLEAQIRFWDILWYPDEIRGKVEGLAQRCGLDVKEPYREGCPFCTHVADSEDEMREHLKEHEIILEYIKGE